MIKKKQEVWLLILSIFNNIKEFFMSITMKDLIEITRYVVDISIVSYIVYKLLIVVKQTRAGQLIKGIVVLLIATQVSGWLGLNAINFILRNTMTVGLLAILIVFQPELRGALERIGRSRFGNLFNFGEHSYEERIKMTVDEIVKASEDLSKTLTGALIVVENETKLGDITKTGIALNANISSELIKNIFFPYAPLHDGAVVIGEGKIKAAGCFLPLTENRNLSKDLGTRHRAAIGITENSDAIVVVISEETGRISIAYEGTLTRNFVPDTLKKALTKIMFPESEEKKKITIWKGRNIWKRVE